MFGLSGITTTLLGAGLVALLSFGGGFYLEHRLDQATVLQMKLDDANTQKQIEADIIAITKAQDKVVLDAAVKEAKGQQQIVTQTQTVTKEITKYVHDAVACPGPTVGLARVLYAAAKGVAPSTLSLAAGQSDDSCSDVAATEVAGWFTAYAGTANANAEQLNALEASVRDIHNSATQIEPGGVP